MVPTLVIARAYRGRPLRRELIDTANGLAYLANPDLMDAIREGESEPVGFPIQDVYAFDEAVFAELEASWFEAETTRSESWERLARPNLAAPA